MDLTPAQKRKLTMDAKRAKKEIKKLELALAGAKAGRPTKEFNAKLKERRESAVKIQNVMRNYLSKKRPIKTAAATKLQTAYRARLARNQVENLTDELNAEKQEKAFDTINNAILGLVAKKRVEKLRAKKFLEWSNQFNTTDPYLQEPLKEKSQARKVIAAAILRRAIQNRGLPEEEKPKFDTGKTGMEDFLQIMQENSDKIYSLDQKLDQIAQAKTIQAPTGLAMEQEMIADAQKTIGNRLIAYNYNKELRRELNLRREFETKSGTIKSVRDVLLKASLDKIAKNRAREKVGGKKTAQELLNAEAKTNVVGAIVNTDLPEANIYEGYEERNISIPAVKAKVGLYGDRISAGRQQMMEEELEEQENARETIGNRLLAYNLRRDYIRELGNFRPINTGSGEVKTAKDILEKALNDYKLKKLARYKIGGIITLRQKLGLEGRLFSADNNRTEDMPGRGELIKKFFGALRRTAQFAQLSENINRRKAGRTIGSSIRRRLAMNKYEWDKDMVGVGMRIGRRRAGSVMSAMVRRRLAMGGYADVNDLGARLRTMATTLPTLQLVADTTPSPTVARAATVVANDIVGRSGNYKPPMGAKGTQERANYMAWLRSERKGGRRTKKQITQANLIKRARFGLPRAYLGRPSSAVAPAPAPTVVPASAAPSRNISALLSRARFGKARRYPGRPRKVATLSAPSISLGLSSSVAPIAPSRNISALLSRARFGKSRRYAGGRPRKVATVASLPNAIVASAAPKKRGRPRKIATSMSVGMMSIPRAVMTGNGAVARRGRPRTLTSDTARLVKDVQRLRGKGKSMKSITYGVLTGSKGTAGKRGRPGIVASDAGRIVKDVLKLRGVRRR